MKEWQRITTAKGSVYHRLQDGKTQRFKTVTGEMSEPQDILVFVKLSAGENQTLLSFIHKRDKEHRVYVVGLKERTICHTEVPRNIDPTLVVMNIKTGEIVHQFETSKIPIVGYQTYDQRRWDDPERGPLCERHLGNKIVLID